MNLRDREYTVAILRTDEKDRIGINRKYHVINNNFMSWTADPFPIEVNGELYIFAEVFLYTKAKGVIGYSKLTKKGFTKWKKVIEEPYHLSFPNLFWKDNVLYMMPESHQDGTLHLYKCEDFPDKWVRDRTIAIGDFNDTILYKRGNEKCIFTYGLDGNFRAYKKEEDKLVKLNLSNQVKNINTSRPAGQVLCIAGKDVIVAQIGKPVYGSGIIFKEIQFHWPDYREKEISRYTARDFKLDKKRNYIGLHTFNCSEKYTVIDLIWEQITVQRIIFRVIRKIKRHIYGENE